jgi:cytochrome P450
MTQGALADTFKRFPAFAAVATVLLSKPIAKLTLDCKLNEEYSLDLVKKRVARKSDRKDFLTRILEQRDSSISDVQIAAHSADFVTAGSETTATALSCITYYLLKDPTLAKKLQDEIRSSFTSYDEINSASTAKLPYLNAVCNEGMRIYPPLAFALPRVVPSTGGVVDGRTLPPGVMSFNSSLLIDIANPRLKVTVSTNPVAACLDSSNFSDPFSFKPERWLEPNGHDNLDASQPFSTGPRGCLGRSLGWMEMKTTLAKLHFMFDLELAQADFDWHESSRMHTLWQKPALPVRVSRARDSGSVGKTVSSSA